MRRTHSGLFHACRSRRRAARSDHRRARHADLPDDLLRLRKRRSRRLAVRPADLRQHLYAHRQPDHCGAGGTRRRARRRHRGACGRLRPCGAGIGLSLPAAARRRVRRVEEALWRLDQPVHSRVQEFRLERGVGRPRRHRLVRARDLAEDQGDLHRVDRQSGRRHHRHGGGRANRQARRRALHRRQHAGHALSVQADRSRRRHRHSFADQISRRPRQFDRRRDRRCRHLQLVARAPLSDAVRAAAGISRHRAARDVRQLRLRHRLPRAGAARSRCRRCRRSTPSSFSPASRRCRCACARIATTRWRSPNGWPRIRRWRG